jgi:hypothetical protein
MRIKKIWWLYIYTVLCTAFLFNGAAQANQEAEQLIVFVQPGASSVDDAFKKFTLPLIKRLAKEMDVAVHVVDASKGVPPEVDLTPLIVYQNHRGRSIYQGRTTTPERIRNFIRTSRFVPQGDAFNQRENIPIWQVGRTRLWAPLKVSGVTGISPVNYDKQVFIDEALEDIKKGFEKFKVQQIAKLGRADRGFYMDFYPWLSQDQTLYLSLALFSQFHCKAPIFKHKITGNWGERQKLFQQAALIMEDAVRRQITDAKSGDSFDPVKRDAPEVAWDKLGFQLPPAPKTSGAQPAANIKLPLNWVLVKSGPTDPPMIQFRFPAPLDNYSGEVTAGQGELNLSKAFQLDGATGFIEIDTRTSITMGDPILDEAIRGSVMLYTKKFSASKFIVETIYAEGQPIAFGQLTPAGIKGIFTLKGKSVPMSSTAEFEPIIDEYGQVRLLIQGAFKIDLRVFNIAGADGPEPAKHTLLFDVNFKLKPKKEAES